MTGDLQVNTRVFRPMKSWVKKRRVYLQMLNMLDTVEAEGEIIRMVLWVFSPQQCG